MGYELMSPDELTLDNRYSVRAPIADLKQYKKGIKELAICMIMDGQYTPIKARKIQGRFEVYQGFRRVDAARLIRKGFKEGKPVRIRDFQLKVEIFDDTATDHMTPVEFLLHQSLKSLQTELASIDEEEIKSITLSLRARCVEAVEALDEPEAIYHLAKLLIGEADEDVQNLGKQLEDNDDVRQTQKGTTKSDRSYLSKVREDAN